VTAFTSKMNNLLLIERDAETEETADFLSQYSFRELEKRNMAITKLFIKHIATGVYGRVLLHLCRGTKKGSIIPANQGAAGKENADRDQPQVKLRVFSPGDIVGLY